MGDKKFTLFELHLDGETQFGPGSIGEALPILRGDVEPTEDVASTSEDDDQAAEDSGGKPIALLAGLVFLVGLALAVRKFRGGDDDLEEPETLDERDVVVN